jgi:L-threonylcarbamoyladenylate synthase
VKENCVINSKAQEWLDKLPGAYTILIPQQKQVIAKNVAPNKKVIGIRYPHHWFSEVVRICGFPIVTTSANKAGEPFMTRLENLDHDIENKVEFMIYEGEKKARPSKIVNVEKEEVKER